MEEAIGPLPFLLALNKADLSSQWEIDEQFSSEYLDLLPGDEVEIEYNPAPEKGESRYLIHNRRTQLTYTAGTMGTVCLVPLLAVLAAIIALVAV